MRATQKLIRTHDVMQALLDVQMFHWPEAPRDDEPLDHEDWLDVRYQLYPDGQWALRTGSSDYDQDHHGFWGCASISPYMEASNLDDIAGDMIEQALDDRAVDLALEEGAQ